VAIFQTGNQRDEGYMQFVHRTDNFKIANIKNIILASNLPINLNRILFKEAGNIEFIFPLVMVCRIK
jgi:hypothetical protein